MPDRHRHRHSYSVYSIGHGARCGFRALLRLSEPVPVFMLMLVLGKNLVVVFVGWKASVSRRIADPSGSRSRQTPQARPSSSIASATRAVLAAFCSSACGSSTSRSSMPSQARSWRPASPRLASCCCWRRQVGADPVACLAAGRDGRPHPGVGADPRGNHGHRGVYLIVRMQGFFVHARSP